ncbi:MAG: zinc metalloprotease HtpX [candidate division Zixibacteria bacterium]|nr:zinc metalloprotease HtpX [candidate division Zixibacteria bacterium]
MNTLKTMFLLTLLTILLIFLGRAIGGPNGMIIAFIIALAMNFGSYWFSDKIVLKLYKAKEVTQQDNHPLYEVVRDLATRARLPMPRVYVIPSESPNAFATGRNPKHAAVAATQGLLRMLNREELEGVMAHELSHVNNRDILLGSIVATIAGTISMVSMMARWTAFFGGGDDEEGGGLGLLIMAIIAPIAAMMIQFAISRSREYAADEGGARISHKPHGLANALRKIHNGAQRIPMNAQPATAHMFILNPLRGKGLVNLFMTHPPVEERIKRLEAMARGVR